MNELILSTIMLFADYGQTRYIVSNSDRYYETNVLLGPNPCASDVDKYFTGVILLNAGVKLLLPKRQAEKTWRIVSIFQASFVTQNQRLGIGFDYRF